VPPDITDPATSKAKAANYDDRLAAYQVPGLGGHVSTMVVGFFIKEIVRSYEWAQRVNYQIHQYRSFAVDPVEALTALKGAAITLAALNPFVRREIEKLFH
jgi:ammonia channel protein AmtB